MKENVFHLSGLHCRSCELLVEHEIKKIPGVDSVKISHKNGILHIRSSSPVNSEAIREAAERAGYPVEDAPSWKTKKILHPETLVRDTIFGLIVAALAWYLIPGIAKTFDPTGGISGNTGLVLTALITGLAAGVSTCMAIAWGLVMAVSAEADMSTSGHGLSGRSLRAQFLFHAGRFTTYAVGGFFLGLLGTAARFSDTFVAVLSAITGIILLRLAISMTELFPSLRAISLPLPESLKRRFSHGEVQKTAPALIGALTFLLPCGFTLAIELAVMRAGDPLLGAVAMATFVLGTTPGLLLLGLAAGWKGKARTSFLRVVGWVIAVFSLITLVGAWNTFSLAFNTRNVPVAVTESGSVNTSSDSGSSASTPKPMGSIAIALTQDGRWYSPQILSIPRNMHVQLVVNSTNNYTCAADFTIPELGIRKFLDSGINTFEFDTPDQAKDIWFGCGMRMFQWTIQIR